MSVDSVRQNCPRCESAVPADARFCMTCGQSLAGGDGPVAARQAQIAAAAPAPLVDKMRAAKLTGERKPVTALFADVVNSTTLAEAMDPEDWTQTMNAAFDVMSQAIFRYEGTIAQLQGDALLAFFGAPVAHEDDPERAVRAALDMVTDTAEFARQLKSAHGIDFNIRAGLNTGPVIVGNVGSDLRYEYTALGDAVNVAARVQNAADPGTVLVTEQTRRFVSNAFDLEDLGETELKGKSEPVHLYRVVGARAEPGTRRGLQSVGLASPLVGRAAELAALQDAFAIARAGRGRLAHVIGEPGIGKSRLLAELKASIEDESDRSGGARWIEGRCLSFGRGVPYHLALDMVRSMLGISPGTPDEQQRAQLSKRLAELLGDEASDVEGYFAHLLSIPLTPAERDGTQLDPETLQLRYVASIKRVVAALAREQPLVLFLEDVHWADKASVDVALALVPFLTSLPVLIVFAGRAETDSAGWRLVTQTQSTLGDAITTLRLEPLNESHSRELVANLLEIESLPEHVRSTILARAEGNPFFVEEVIRMFIESGAIVRTGDRWIANDTILGIEIPDTLRGLLLARIDQLPDDAKRSLRVAAVIGRQFPVRVLERVLADG